MKKLMQNRKKGFTLVELIVVIVIIAILIAALTPAIMGVINRANESADRAELRVILLEAQAAAIDNNGNVVRANAAAAAVTANTFGHTGVVLLPDDPPDNNLFPAGIRGVGNRSGSTLEISP